MTTLTPEERERLAKIKPGAIVRDVKQWREILAGLNPHDAAARIFGDLICYRAEQRNGLNIERRHGFFDDVAQLARALDAWAEIHDLPAEFAWTVGTPVDQTNRETAEHARENLQRGRTARRKRSPF